MKILNILCIEECEERTVMGQLETDRDEIGNLISLSEAAKYLHVSYATAFRLVRDGELKAFRIKNIWRTSDVLCREYVRKQLDEQAVICHSTEAE